MLKGLSLSLFNVSDTWNSLKENEAIISMQMFNSTKVDSFVRTEYISFFEEVARHKKRVSLNSEERKLFHFHIDFSSQSVHTYCSYKCYRSCLNPCIMDLSQF